MATHAHRSPSLSMGGPDGGCVGAFAWPLWSRVFACCHISWGMQPPVACASRCESYELGFEYHAFVAERPQSPFSGPRHLPSKPQPPFPRALLIRCRCGQRICKIRKQSNPNRDIVHFAVFRSWSAPLHAQRGLALSCLRASPFVCQLLAKQGKALCKGVERLAEWSLR